MKAYFLIFLILIVSCISKSPEPENYLRINDSLYSGGSPEEDHFAFLKSQGIKSIICVDGLEPNLNAAKKHGLAYRHVPIEYSTITLEEQKQLTKAFDELDKPVYIHCHHGKHRGPASAAVILKNHFEWKNEKLVKMMENAGTSKNYSGLYKVISTSNKLPKKDWQKIDVPEVARVSPLANTMAKLDRHWVKLEELINDTGKLKESQSQALILKEYFVELHRAPGTKFDEEYEVIVEKIKFLEVSLKNNGNSKKAFAAVKADCKSCHDDYRN